MNNPIRLASILLIISLLLTSCASTKDFKTNSLITLGAVAGMVAGAKLDSKIDNGDTCPEGTGCAGGGGGLMFFLGGLLGALFGFGVDVATTPKSNQEHDKEKSTRPSGMAESLEYTYIR